MKKLDSLIEKCRKGESEILTILEEIVREDGYVSFEKLNHLSRELNIPLARLYGTASFYSFLPTKKCGKYIIRVCESPSCYLSESRRLVDFLKMELKIGLGETTKDGRFSLEKTSCLGQCDKSPAMMINDKIYTSLTESGIRQILGGLK